MHGARPTRSVELLNAISVMSGCVCLCRYGVDDRGGGWACAIALVGGAATRICASCDSLRVWGRDRQSGFCGGYSAIVPTGGNRLCSEAVCRNEMCAPSTATISVLRSRRGPCISSCRLAWRARIGGIVVIVFGGPLPLLSGCSLVHITSQQRASPPPARLVGRDGCI